MLTCVASEVLIKSEPELLYGKANMVSNDSAVAAKSNRHILVGCDRCAQTPIVGVRLKCAVCQDVDFCLDCHMKEKNLHPHPFIWIPFDNVF